MPPTPTKQLLPIDETDGLTSGAVRPPGSTGVEENATKTHELVRVTVGESGEEGSDGSSEDELSEDGQQVEEWEDDEQRLIRQGGAGIPLGPVSLISLSIFVPTFPTSLLRSSAPWCCSQSVDRTALAAPAACDLAQHAGGKCLVLDLDETLVHSSLRVSTLSLPCIRRAL